MPGQTTEAPRRTADRADPSPARRDRGLSSNEAEGEVLKKLLWNALGHLGLQNGRADGGSTGRTGEGEQMYIMKLEVSFIIRRVALYYIMII